VSPSLLFIDQILSDLSREISEILEKPLPFFIDLITFRENFVKANGGIQTSPATFLETVLRSLHSQRV
jgi:hypothetical protein